MKNYVERHALYVPQCVSHVSCCAIGAVVHRTPQKRIAAQRVDIPVPQMMEEIVEVVPVTPHERDRQNCAAQVVGLIVPVMKEENREGDSAFPSRSAFMNVLRNVLRFLSLWSRKKLWRCFTFGHRSNLKNLSLDSLGPSFLTRSVDSWQTAASSFRAC